MNIYRKNLGLSLFYFMNDWYVSYFHIFNHAVKIINAENINKYQNEKPDDHLTYKHLYVWIFMSSRDDCDRCLVAWLYLPETKRLQNTAGNQGSKFHKLGLLSTGPNWREPVSQESELIFA